MMREGIAVAGFITGAVFIAVGLGGVQSSLQPFIGLCLLLSFFFFFLFFLHRN